MVDFFVSLLFSADYGWLPAVRMRVLPLPGATMELVGQTPEMRRMDENSSVPFPEMESIPAPWKTYSEPEPKRILCDVKPVASK